MRHECLLWRRLCLRLILCTCVLLFVTVEGCNEFEFECSNLECIRGLYRCDRDRDCLDGSDEEGCDDISCTDDLFKCSSGRCIPKAFLCDSDEDCEDGIDEKNCSYTNSYTDNSTAAPLPSPTAIPGRIYICENWQFQCHSGPCIRSSYQCDDDKDCPDGSDELGCEPCVSTSTLSTGNAPFCKVRVYKGAMRIRNETLCAQDDVFRIKPARLPYERRSFTETRVNYLKMNCEAYYPLNFVFDGVGSIEQIRVHRSQKVVTPTSAVIGYKVHYVIEVTTVAIPQATGHYIFSEIQTNASVTPKKTSLFFYVEKDKKPFLLGRERIQNAKKIVQELKNGENEEVVILPCVSSKANVAVYLYKEINETWSKVDNTTFRYNPLRGFELSVSALDAKKYRCTTDQSFTSDADVVTIVVNNDLLTPLVTPKESNLKIVFGNGLSATCHFIRPESNTGSKFEFLNIYAENPLEANVLADCVLKGSQSCGSYSHLRNHHPTSDDLMCRHDNQKTKCRHISEIYMQGVLICQSETEYLVQQYFTGLDDKLYKDWRDAPKSALIKLEPSTLSQNLTIIAGSTLTTKCAAVSMVFGRTAIGFEVRSSGTDVIVKHSNGGYQTWAFTLRENNTQLLCLDHTWETNEEILSEPINVNVTRRIVSCTFLEFKCDNGQCIRSSYRCDKDRDCVDGSDELNCPTTTSTTVAPVTCSSLQFPCHKSSLTRYASNTCIPATYRCDGDKDCTFGEDEENCPSTTTTSTTTTTTTTTTTEAPNGGCGINMFKCNNGDCIRAQYRCDHEKDCKDGSDEAPTADCPTPPPPPPSSSTTASPLEEKVEEVHSEEVQVDDWSVTTSDKKESNSDNTSSSSFKIALIVIGVILVVVCLSLVSYKLYTHYRGRNRVGTSTSSNIKYSNPTCDQEEVLIS